MYICQSFASFLSLTNTELSLQDSKWVYLVGAAWEAAAVRIVVWKPHDRVIKKTTRKENMLEPMKAHSESPFHKGTVHLSLKLVI